MNKILIVEDSLPIIQLHSYLVKKAGFEPVTAATFAEVKNLDIDLNEFFCAIIDYSLPDAPDGEAIPYLLDKKVPGIVMTGMLDDNIRDKMLKLPIIDYITKESKQAYNYLHNLILRLQKNVQVKVLVVDDAQSARSFLRHLLERHNYHVLTANSGSDALEQLKIHSDIKLVITDKEMPNMDGLELCNEIRATHNKDEISIIGISGADNPSLTAKFIKNGANDFLKKPFCPEEFYCRIQQNIEYIESLETITRQANTDFLTALYNRRYFFESLSPLVKSKKEQTLAMLDIDFFKSINDNHGHEVGDVVLKAVSGLLTKHFSQQLVARLGGEEFSVHFGSMAIDQAENLLEDFRVELASTSITANDKNITCTISVGLTCGVFNSLDQLINRADELLYEAKDTGRNKIVANR